MGGPIRLDVAVGGKWWNLGWGTVLRNPRTAEWAKVLLDVRRTAQPLSDTPAAPGRARAQGRVEVKNSMPEGRD